MSDREREWLTGAEIALEKALRENDALRAILNITQDENKRIRQRCLVAADKLLQIFIDKGMEPDDASIVELVNLLNDIGFGSEEGPT